MEQLYSIREHIKTKKLHVFECYKKSKDICELSYSHSICREVTVHETSEFFNKWCLPYEEIVLECKKTKQIAFDTDEDDVFCKQCRFR